MARAGAVSAIVVSYRTGPVLASSLAALARARDVSEIVIVDNGNPPEGEAIIDRLAQVDARMKVLRGGGNVGFAKACNAGARAAKGGVLAFVNPDVVLAPDALTRLAGVLEQHATLAIVGGDLRDEAGRPERGARRRRVTLWRAFVSFSGLSAFGRIFPALRDVNLHAAPMPPAPERVGGVSGALMLMRAADFARVGGFDEQYFLHVEDVDLCRRIEDAGGAVVFAPGPHGVHHRSSSDAPSAEIARYKAQSFARYFRKFARNGLERACTELVVPFLALALRVRG